MTQNEIALRDTTRTLKTKTGELEFTRSVLVGDVDRLEELNSGLADEIKKERGRVVTLSRLLASVKSDTITITPEITLTDSTITTEWAHFDSSAGGTRTLEGNTVITAQFDSLVVQNATTTITRDEIFFTIVTGLRERDDVFEIFARTEYEGASFGLEGAIVDIKPFFPKKKKWAIGPTVGLGFVGDRFGGIIGIGATYGVIRL